MDDQQGGREVLHPLLQASCRPAPVHRNSSYVLLAYAAVQPLKPSKAWLAPSSPLEANSQLTYAKSAGVPDVFVFHCIMNGTVLVSIITFIRDSII